MRILSYLFLVVIILLGITFALLNPGLVTINYYVGRSTLSLSLLLVLVFATGCLLGILASLFWLLRLKISNYRLNQRLKLAEKEVENLRAIPLQDKH